MFINKKIKSFCKKKSYLLLFIFIFLNLLACLLSYNQINYIHEIKYDFNRINKLNDELQYPLSNSLGVKFIPRSLISDLNKKNLVQPKFEISKYNELSNKIMIWKIYYDKNYLVFEISSKKKFEDEEIKYFTYVENFLKLYLLEELDREKKFYKFFYNLPAQEIYFSLLNSEINKLNYQQEGIKRDIKYTYIKNIFGIFNSIFILIVFILYHKKR